MTYLLYIDTSAQQGSVAITDGKQLIHRVTNESERDHAATINRNIDIVLAEAGVTLSEVKAVAVIGGPGSYTGLRIGLATAKGLCYALQIPLLMHSKLDLMCLQGIKEQQGYSHYVALLPARQDEYFVAVYDHSGECIYPPRHIYICELETLLNGLAGKMLIAGKKEMLPLHNGSVVLDIDTFSEAVWYEKAYEDFSSQRFADIATAVPFYLKSVYTTQKKAG